MDLFNEYTPIKSDNAASNPIFGKDNNISVFHNITKYRLEGVAAFLKNKDKKFIEYNKEDARLSRLANNNYKGIGHIPKLYHYLYHSCGMYMCYFIGLSSIYEKYPVEFNAMKAYLNKNDFLFFVDGMGNILNSGEDKIYLQNLPENLIYSISKVIPKYSHLTFIKEYQKACNILQVPEDQVIITFSDYIELKKIAYGIWVKNK